MAKVNIDEIAAKLKAGIPPTDEEVAAIREAMVEIGKIFEVVKVHILAAADVLHSFVDALPEEFMAEIERMNEERGDASSR